MRVQGVRPVQGFGAVFAAPATASGLGFCQPPPSAWKSETSATNRLNRAQSVLTELRTIAADQLWMSPCYTQPSLAIHFTGGKFRNPFLDSILG